MTGLEPVHLAFQIDVQLVKAARYCEWSIMCLYHSVMILMPAKCISDSDTDTDSWMSHDALYFVSW